MGHVSIRLVAYWPTVQFIFSRSYCYTIWEKRERGRIQGLPKFFEYPLLYQERVIFRVPPLSQEWVKLRTSYVARTFIGSIGTKGH